MRHTVTFQEKSKGFANQTFRLLLVGRSRSGFSSPDSDTYYTLGLAVETITESSMNLPSGSMNKTADMSCDRSPAAAAWGRPVPPAPVPAPTRPTLQSDRSAPPPDPGATAPAGRLRRLQPALPSRVLAIELEAVYFNINLVEQSLP